MAVNANEQQPGTQKRPYSQPKPMATANALYLALDGEGLTDEQTKAVIDAVRHLSDMERTLDENRRLWSLVTWIGELAKLSDDVEFWRLRPALQRIQATVERMRHGDLP